MPNLLRTLRDLFNKDTEIKEEDLIEVEDGDVDGDPLTDEVKD